MSLKLVSEIVHELINADIAIEINTSSLRKGYHESIPDSEILKQYLDLGGTRVSIGSDAHSCGEIAKALPA